MLLGLAGLTTFLAAAKRILTARESWVATVFLALSFHSVFFGATAFECGTVLLGASSIFLLFERWHEAPTTIRGVVFGGWTGHFLLTYPGLLLGLLAFTTSCVIWRPLKTFAVAGAELVHLRAAITGKWQHSVPQTHTAKSIVFSLQRALSNLGITFRSRNELAIASTSHLR